MSGETIEVVGTPMVLENSGVALANGALTAMSSGSYNKMTASGGYPDAQFVLTCQFAVAPQENSRIAVYARPLLVDGTNNAQVPEATRPTRIIGYFDVNDVTTQQTMEFMEYDIPRNAWYYLHNVNTGQSISNGWAVTINPRSYKPAP